MCKLLRAFDPTFAAQHLVPDMVDELVQLVLPLQHHVDAAKLKKELPIYLSCAAEVDESNIDDVATYSNQVLSFWKSTPSTELMEWRRAARIAFSISPNSASCERVFSLLECMYDELQLHTLADHLQASLMLRYNGRAVEC